MMGSKPGLSSLRPLIWSSSDCTAISYSPRRVNGIRCARLDELDVGVRIEDLHGSGAAGIACLIDPQRRLVVLRIRRSHLQHG